MVKNVVGALVDTFFGNSANEKKAREHELALAELQIKQASLQLQAQNKGQEQLLMVGGVVVVGVGIYFLFK